MKLSVIVPVYNAAKYLEACIDSILMQSFRDFELVLVNDGSVDDSLEICLRYQQEDARVKVINKQNGGVSSARNCGINVAKGEWLYFVDADDSINEGLFDIFNADEQCDIIQFGFNTIQLDGTSIVKAPLKDQLFLSADDFIIKSSFHTLTLWVHFIKTDVVRNNNISFTEGVKYAEDLEFVIKCYGCAKAIKTWPVVGYNYFVRENSAMSTAYTFENAKIHLCVAENIIYFYDINKLKKGIFFQSRIEYMVKSYFSYSVMDNNTNVSSLKDLYKEFLKKTNIQYLFTSFLKLSTISPVLYFYLLRTVCNFKIR
ncbi:glycosyltransferase family 2 protein [Sphingobacterium rhinopitheci]|uniref:glycosyltransferase family 2 protein n=1 Tax=Sphingobacterium rhinopitheci TaxID=2781960 RepID=UPI001F524473|nr:glycosyltransferase [Sphingobacterium rhinopitheci]MCI0920632.1 glycosyltransferase [Sphingobacterium rhinopitheci]